MAFNNVSISGVVSQAPGYFETDSGIGGCNFYIRSSDVSFPIQFTMYGDASEKGAASLQVGDYVNITGHINTRQSRRTGNTFVALVADYVENISAILDVMDSGDDE